MRQFDTSIKKIMNEKNKYNSEHDQEAIFLSNWDSDVDVKPYGIFFDGNNIIGENTDISSYYYWTDEHEYSFFFQNLL